MSYIDGIRARLADPEAPWLLVRVDVAEELCNLADAAADHRPSEGTATRGEHKGRRYCVACTTYCDGEVPRYVDWPCPIGAVLDRLHGGDEAKLARIRAMRPDDETDAT